MPRAVKGFSDFFVSIQLHQDKSHNHMCIDCCYPKGYNLDTPVIQGSTMADLIAILGFIITDRLQTAAFQTGMQLGRELRQLIDSIAGHSPSEGELYDRLATLLHNDSALVKLQYVDCDDCGHLVGEAITKGNPTKVQGIERIRISAIVSCYSNKPICTTCARRRYSRTVDDWVGEQAHDSRYPPDEDEITEAAHRVSEVCLQLARSYR